MPKAVFKNASNKPVEFIPKAQADDATLSKSAAEIKDRPTVFMVRKTTREDRLNMRGLVNIEDRNGEVVVINAGTISRYLWENCVTEVHNVILDDKEYDVVIGKEKNSLFGTEGMEPEIMECLNFIQGLSAFTESEAKK